MENAVSLCRRVGDGPVNRFREDSRAGHAAWIVERMARFRIPPATVARTAGLRESDVRAFAIGILDDRSHYRLSDSERMRLSRAIHRYLQGEDGEVQREFKRNIRGR